VNQFENPTGENGLPCTVMRKVNGEMHYLWRAVDHESEVLEVLATKERDKAAALKLMKRLMKRYGRPETVVTDGLRSYRNSGSTRGRRRIAGLTTGPRTHTNRSDDESERCCDFAGMKTLQKFAAVHGTVHNHFNQERHLTSRETYKQNRSDALAEWKSLMA
jgi:putative transposase